MESDQEGEKKNTNNHLFIPKNFDFLKIYITRINVFTNAMKFSLEIHNIRIWNGREKILKDLPNFHCWIATNCESNDWSSESKAHES